MDPIDVILCELEGLLVDEDESAVEDALENIREWAEGHGFSLS